MKQIYFDNAATSYPKPLEVSDNIFNYITNVGLSPNRSTASYISDNIVYDTRVLIADFFHFSTPENVIFTKNITESLNIVLLGLLKKGDHIIASNLEHNAVYRPLNILKKRGVEVDFCDLSNGVEKFIKNNTKAVVMPHASNVSGKILPIETVGKYCKSHGIVFIVDSAQTAGVFDIDMDYIDILTFTGHKSLLSIQGIGGFLIKKSDLVNPLIHGGTGNFSENETMPSVMPYKFEAGTPNIPGICGLYHGISYINEIGLENICKKELSLLKYFKNSLANLNGFDIVDQGENFCPTISLNFNVCDNAEIASFLLENSIVTRCGLHCAPLAHKTLNTFPKGTIRFSFGYNNTFEEIDFCVEKIKEFINLCKN